MRNTFLGFNLSALFLQRIQAVVAQIRVCFDSIEFIGKLGDVHIDPIQCPTAEYCDGPAARLVLMARDSEFKKRARS